MLAIGRALMARPSVLLLDEPSLGLAPILVDTIFQIIVDINGQGTTVLLVEQNALKALAVAQPRVRPPDRARSCSPAPGANCSATTWSARPTSARTNDWTFARGLSIDPVGDMGLPFDSLDSGLTVTDRRFVLLTGAAGRIGSAFRQETGERYRFRLADLRTEDLAQTPGEGHEVMQLDVSDAAACAAACAASTPSSTSRPTLRRRRSGNLRFCRTISAAPSMSFAPPARPAAGGSSSPAASTPSSARLPGRRSRTTPPPAPVNLYGASKVFRGSSRLDVRGERSLRDLHPHRRLRRAMVLRARRRPSGDGLRQRPRSQRSARPLHRDRQHSLRHRGGRSNNRRNRFDLKRTRELLGYEPRDDGFAVLGIEPDGEGVCQGDRVIGMTG